MARHCLDCGTLLTEPYVRRCPECREKKREKTSKLILEKKKEAYKQKIGGKYKYNKNYGLEEKKEPEKLLPGSAAWEKASPYKRMESMNLSAFMAECKKRGITYRDAQLMSDTHQLPDDWGLLAE